MNEVEKIEIRGARSHNLKNLSLDIPRNKITVITGLSGSGKSTLAFDTIFAEGQRRYIESLSAYARQFLEQLQKPDVDAVMGLSPAIAIDQKSVGHNPRSTVGTMTEIADYLRLLFAKVGTAYCPEHNEPMAAQSAEQMVEEILAMGNNLKLMILAPVAQAKKGEFLAEFQKWSRMGYIKARVDGAWVELATAKKLAKTKTHTIELVVDQVIVKKEAKARILAAVEKALQLTKGHVISETIEGERRRFSQFSSCPVCARSFPELEPRLFSFNNPRGACPTCTGLGTLDLVEETEVESDSDRKVIKATRYRLRAETKSQTDEDSEEETIEFSECPTCHGTRLNSEALAVRIQQKNIAELTDLSTLELASWVKNLTLNTRHRTVAEKIKEQILERLNYLIRVGVGYLSLSRSSRSLSGGEAQRIRLASQVGSGLVGVLYVMDEPSIGLHPRDHRRLLDIIEELRDKGNTILLVEHDEETIRCADWIIDLGPRAGKLGGEILASGNLNDILNNPNSLTGAYLSGRKKVFAPKKRRPGNGQFLELKGATGNNLQNVDLKIPLGTLTVVTGVSGSGKSTLIVDTLYRILAQKFYQANTRPQPYKAILGMDHVDKVIDINQRPIGRTPRSTPATYTGLFPLIRDLFATLPEAKMRGYPPGRFSFNVKGGRCETCLGHGQIRLEMHFLADVFVTCESCGGRRYNRETELIKWNGKSISDVLQMTVEEAFEFFKNVPQIARKLETLHKVGLDYISLGQSSTTLSGGEAQRIKLAKELSKRSTGKTLFILDEPSTGLHFQDIAKLGEILEDLVEQGNTVLVIEHNLDLIRLADHLIDLGPDGGNLGGQIVATGTPEQVAKNSNSLTGKFL